MQRISNKVMVGLFCCSFLCCSMAVSCRLGESLDGYSSDNQVDALADSEDSSVPSEAQGGSGGSGGSGGTGGGGVIEGPSCNGLPKTCGDNGNTSCCSSIEVPGGSFPMGRGGGSDAFSNDKTDEQPEHDVTVSGFSLDEFEVTVGRFRRFVKKYDEEGTKPKAGAGAHPKIDGSGWKEEWNDQLPNTATDLKDLLRCKYSNKFIELKFTWSDEEKNTEQLPINCVNWYVAFAFCAWDGGRLPTEAEWEYAAAGGDENRLYPWGSEVPDDTRAAFDCRYSDGVADGCVVEDIAKVGMHPKGQGRWGHKDLAGNINEWVLDEYKSDWYKNDGNECIDCANLTDKSDSPRVARGASFFNNASNLRAVFRFALDFDVDPRRGVRCARDGKM